MSRPIRWYIGAPLGSLFCSLVLLWICSLPGGTGSFDQDWSTVVQDKDGHLLGASIAADGQWRFTPDLEVPERYKQALIAFEDRRFYFHKGFDPLGILRALRSNIEAGDVVSGGSTITMQVIRMTRGSPPRTMGEKILEAFLAFRLEFFMTKDKILKLYAATAPYGANVVGLEAACWRWFGHSPESLSWGEAATLAVLPNSPGLIHLVRLRDSLVKKRDALLQVMFQRGTLGEEDLRLALAEKLPASPRDIPQSSVQLLNLVKKLQSAGDAGRGASEALDALPGFGGTAHPPSTGLGIDDGVTSAVRVTTSIDIGIQSRVASILERRRPTMEANDIHNAAILVLETATGRVVAYHGNLGGAETGPSNRDTGGWNDLIFAQRSTGSTLKPFLYAALLENGAMLPQSIVPDIPTRYGSYSPENNVNSYSGAVPADSALARSLNIPATRELRLYGVQPFVHLLKDLGMTTLWRNADDYGLPLILGGAEGSLWELTNMYADMGRVLLRKSVVSPFSPETVWLTFEALSKVARPDEEAAWQNFTSSRPVAWKTGTSFGFRDAWTIGVNPRYTVGVWVGNASGKGRPELRGVSYAAPLLFDVLGSLPDAGWFSKPQSLVKVKVCAHSGYLAGPNCRDTVEIDASPKGAESGVCPYCQIVHLDPSGKFQVTANDIDPAAMKNEKYFVLPPAMEWYYKRNNVDYKPLPPFMHQQTDTSDHNFNILTPDPGARFFIPIQVDGTPGLVNFRAFDRDENAVLYWHIDGSFVASTRGEHVISVRPGRGTHLLVVMDQSGDFIQRQFEVLSSK